MHRRPQATRTCLALAAVAASVLAQLACRGQSPGGPPASATTPPSTVAPAVSAADASRALDAHLKANPKESAKIFRGTKASAGEYPWMVAFADADRPGQATCGGSLVSSEWILTAAHCQLKAAEDVAHLGRVDLKAKGGPAPRRIDAFCRNPQGADLALAHLAQPATETPIAFATEADLTRYAGEPMRILGWGLKESGGLSRELLFTDVKVLADQECRQRLAGVLTVCPSCFCGWLAGTIADACSGDSGGPAAVLSPGSSERVQIGVIQEGAGCGAAPGVYAFVPAHAAWIDSTIDGPPGQAQCGS